MRIETDLEHVTVTLSPLESMLSIKHRLEIPVDRITSVAAMDRGDVGIGSLVRNPGTHIPGLIRYGSYGIGEHRQFWATVRRSRLLVIDATGWKYSRIVLSIADPDQVAGTISAAVRK